MGGGGLFFFLLFWDSVYLGCLLLLNDCYIVIRFVFITVVTSAIIVSSVP